MRGVFVIRAATIHAILCPLVLRGRILRPASVIIVVTACIDRFAFCLATSTIIRTVAIAGTSSGLLILENPCMAAARGASPAVLRAIAVVLINISS